MRIRKRQVPCAPSSLSPVPLSDPHFSLSPAVSVSLQLSKNPHRNLLEEDDTAAYFNPPPPIELPIGVRSGNKGCFSAARSSELRWGSDQDLLDKDERGGEEEMKDDTRKGSSFNAEIGTVILQQSSSSQVVGRCCEGEKTFPLKKRKGSIDRRSNDEEMVMGKDQKMKTKINQKCLQQYGSKEEEEDNKETKKNGDGTSICIARKRARGGALMEGSRCSRVNGRGWRCCQQTLVGYSLCEHHLGKGRLRSMNSIRRQSMVSTTAKKAKSQPLSCASFSSQERRETMCVLPGNEINGENEDIDEKKPLIIGKKKMKLGVKARSISSLLN